MMDEGDLGYALRSWFLKDGIGFGFFGRWTRGVDLSDRTYMHHERGSGKRGEPGGPGGDFGVWANLHLEFGRQREEGVMYASSVCDKGQRTAQYISIFLSPCVYYFLGRHVIRVIDQ